MAANLYVYYRTSGNFLPDKQLATDLLAEVSRLTGITGRLLQRRDDAGTWMEIYEGIADCDVFDQQLAAALARDARWHSLIRKQEWFIEL
jgi:hypothetical protein